MSDTTPGESASPGDVARIVELQLGLMRGSHPCQRGQHAKAHGVVAARFEVLDELAPDLKIGLFARPATYTALIRFSNGGQPDDAAPDVHGMAIKLTGVAGRKILDAEADETTHDFILADNPVFFIRDAAEYARFIDDFARAVPQGGQPLAFMAWLLLHHPQDLPVLLRFPHHVQNSPLEARYWSQVPYAFGADGICRYSVTPDPDNAVPALAMASTGADRLQDAMVERLTRQGRAMHFDFAVQLSDESGAAVIDNPTVEWDAPFRTVARITVPPQVFASPAQMAFCDGLSFTPWHALPDHRPLGQINAIRRDVYLASTALRHAIATALRPASEPTAEELALFTASVAGLA